MTIGGHAYYNSFAITYKNDGKHLLQKDYIGVREMQFCSQIVRKTKKKELHFRCNSLIFSVDQVGLEPTTSRL